MTAKKWLLVSAFLCGACDGGATGTLQVQLEAEDTITAGLDAGSGDEDIVDGWTVRFDKYVIAIGEIEIEGGGDGHFHEHDVTVIDLKQVPEGGFGLATFTEMPAGAWPEVFFEMPAATAEAVRHPSVTQADFDRMVAGGCNYLITGSITKPDGQRCPRGDRSACEAATEIDFDLCVPAPTVFGPCESDTGIEGLVVAEGATTTVNFTIHGDHLFFNGFPVGDEGSVVRRAQWLADADVNADGTVTREDLESIGSSDLGQLLPSNTGDNLPGFTLAGAPMIDGQGLRNAWDYTRAQLKTQGHFQGEGECPADGMGHEHED